MIDIDSSYATEHTDLQVFYNAGTDDVVFLFINESDMAVTFRANVSGYETARVTVNPNTTNIEDAEGVENAEDYSGTPWWTMKRAAGRGCKAGRRNL